MSIECGKCHHLKEDCRCRTQQPVQSPMELLKLLGYVNAMIGYCQSLRVGTVITDGYMKRMDEHYIPNTQKACLLIADLVDRTQAPKRESGALRSLDDETIIHFLTHHVKYLYNPLTEKERRLIGDIVRVLCPLTRLRPLSKIEDQEGK